MTILHEWIQSLLSALDRTNLNVAMDNVTQGPASLEVFSVSYLEDSYLWTSQSIYIWLFNPYKPISDIHTELNEI